MGRLGSRAKQRDKQQLLFAAAIVCIIILIASALYYFSKSPPCLNKMTLCPSEGPKGHFVLLVDKTDPLNFTQKQAFMTILRELIEQRTPEGYLVSVFALDEDFKTTADPLIELCNPGTGAGKSEYTANLKRLRRQYEDKFLGPLLKQAESLVAAQPAKVSPIFEMLQLVGINAFRRHNVKGERRLIIMSDMLHNTPQFSMYRGLDDFESFAASDYGRKAQPELRGVDVELHYLINSPKLQTRRNLKFWEDYFNKAGARIVAVRPLEG